MAVVSERPELLFALCHEMGNLVGAIRLQTHLLDQEMTPRDLATARSEIDVLGARVSALLLLVRPIEEAVSPWAGDGLDPDDVLRVVEHGLEPLILPEVEIEFAPSGATQSVRVDRNALQSLVTSFVHLAVEQVRSNGGRVRVAVERADGRTGVSIEDDGGLDASLDAWQGEPLRGRTLICAIADRILEGVGGAIDTTSSAAGSRVVLWAPHAGAV